MPAVVPVSASPLVYIWVQAGTGAPGSIDRPPIAVREVLTKLEGLRNTHGPATSLPSGEKEGFVFFCGAEYQFVPFRCLPVMGARAWLSWSLFGQYGEAAPCRFGRTPCLLGLFYVFCPLPGGELPFVAKHLQCTTSGSTGLEYLFSHL